MAEETAKANTTEQSQAAPKRKSTTTRRKTTTTRRKSATTARKSPTRSKSAARGRSTTGSSTGGRRRAAARRTTSLQERVGEAGRKAFLAGLGFYGLAYDQMQEQFRNVEDELQARRKKADKLYADMVKRGEKVEKQARKRLDGMELPKLELDELTDRSKIEARIDRARERFAELRESVGFKAAA